MFGFHISIFSCIRGHNFEDQTSHQKSSLVNLAIFPADDLAATNFRDFDDFLKNFNNISLLFEHILNSEY